MIDRTAVNTHCLMRLRGGWGPCGTCRLLRHYFSLTCIVFIRQISQADPKPLGAGKRLSTQRLSGLWRVLEVMQRLRQSSHWWSHLGKMDARKTQRVQFHCHWTKFQNISPPLDQRAKPVAQPVLYVTPPRLSHPNRFHRTVSQHIMTG